MKVEKIGKMSVNDFFRLSFEKVIIDIIISAVLVAMFFSWVPWARGYFLQLNVLAKIIDLIINILVYSVILYPLSCFLVFFFKKKREERKKRKKS